MIWKFKLAFYLISTSVYFKLLTWVGQFNNHVKILNLTLKRNGIYKDLVYKGWAGVFEILYTLYGLKLCLDLQNHNMLYIKYKNWWCHDDLANTMHVKKMLPEGCIATFYLIYLLPMFIHTYDFRRILIIEIC